MRTPETAATFTRDLEACRDTETAARETARHIEYDRRVETMLAQVRAIQSPTDRARVCKLLIALGGPGCLSGSLDFTATSRALRLFGVTRAAGIFEHDRAAVAAMSEMESV